MYLKEERVLAVNLKPGDLFSFEPLTRLSVFAPGPINVLPLDNPGATGFGHFHVRTHVPVDQHDLQAIVYKVTVVVEESDKTKDDSTGGTQKTL